VNIHPEGEMVKSRFECLFSVTLQPGPDAAASGVVDGRTGGGVDGEVCYLLLRQGIVP
jgi:hypothetical protein